MQEKLTGAAHGKEIAIHCAADRGSLAVELQVVNMGMAGQPDADFDCTVACVLLGFVKSLFRPTCQNIDLNQSEERRKNTIWRACCDHRTSGQWGILTVVLVCRFHCIHPEQSRRHGGMR